MGVIFAIFAVLVIAKVAQVGNQTSAPLPSTGTAPAGTTSTVSGIPTHISGIPGKVAPVFLGGALKQYRSNVPVVQSQPQVEAAWGPTGPTRKGVLALPPIGFDPAIKQNEGYYA